MQEKHKTIKKILTVSTIIVAGIVIVSLLAYSIAGVVINSLDVSEGIKSKFIFGDMAGQLVVTAIGALLGFGASLFLENYFVKRSKEKAIDNIVAEMSTMSALLDRAFTVLNEYLSEYMENIKGKIDKMTEDEKKVKIDDMIEEEVKVLIDCDEFRKRLNKAGHRLLGIKIYIPIWDSILQNGDLLKFKDKPYFNALIAYYTVLISIKQSIDGSQNSLSFDEVLSSFLEYKTLLEKTNEFLSADADVKKMYEEYYKKEKKELEDSSTIRLTDEEKVVCKLIKNSGGQR